MMIRTDMTDEQLVKFNEALNAIRAARDILTNLAGPCNYDNGESRTMLKQKFMNDALKLQHMVWTLRDSYEGCMKYKQRQYQ